MIRMEWGKPNSFPAREAAATLLDGQGKGRS